MENNKLSTGLTVWLWIIFVVNVLAAIGGIVVALGASVVGAALGLGSIYVVLSFIGVILQIVITVSIGILLFAHKKILIKALGTLLRLSCHQHSLVLVILSKQLFQPFLCRLLHIYLQRTTLQMAQ